MKKIDISKTDNNINSIIVSLILNIIITLFTILASIIMFTGFNYMHVNETIFE